MTNPFKRLINNDRFYTITKVNTAIWVLAIYLYSAYIIATDSLGMGIVFALVMGYLVYDYLYTQYKNYREHKRLMRIARMIRGDLK